MDLYASTTTARLLLHSVCAGAAADPATLAKFMAWRTKCSDPGTASTAQPSASVPLPCHRRVCLFGAVAWSDARTEYNHMVGVEEKDTNRRYFEDQCMVNDFWFQYSGTGLWGTKEPDIDKDYVDVPKLEEVTQAELAFCSDKTKTVPLFLDTCSKIFGTANIPATTIDPVGQTLLAVYGKSSKEGTADRVAEAEHLLKDTAKCLSAQPFALVAQAFVRKDAAEISRNLAAVTPAQLGDPQCGELQTYSMETIGPVRRPLNGYDENLCELSTVKCPLVFSISKDVNPAGPKNVTLEGARCGQHFYFLRTFVLSRAQSSFMEDATKVCQCVIALWALASPSLSPGTDAALSAMPLADCVKAANGGFTLLPSFLFTAVAAGLAVFGARARFA